MSRPLPPPRPIALLGMRAAGKTTCGRILARRLERAFLDLDDELVKLALQAGFRSDAADEPVHAGDVLREWGRARFRDVEATALRRILEPGCLVVLATGGGVVEREDNRVWLERASFNVFLSVPVEVLQVRLERDGSDRPPLLEDDAAAEIPALLRRREPWYRELADLLIEVGDEPPERVAERVLAALKGLPTGNN